MKKHSLSHLLRPTLLKVGIGCLLLSCLLYYSFNGQPPNFIREVDGKIIDTMFNIRGTQDSSGSVVIVDIDEKSLKEHGQWPWPRNTLAELFNKIGTAQPRVIGVDLIFAEKDRSSPSSIFSRYQHLLLECEYFETFSQRIDRQLGFDHDKLLSEAFISTGSVLSYMFLFREDFLKEHRPPPTSSVKVTLDESTTSYSDMNLISAYRAVTNIPVLSTGTASGFANIFPDPSGTVRRAPLFVLLDDLPYPSLAVEMVRVAWGVDQTHLHLATLDKAKYRPLKGGSVDKSFVSTDTTGQLYINYRGPYNTFLYISATDILNNSQIDVLQDKYVLVGSSATGVLDLYPTPFAARLPGIEIHANVVDNMIMGDAMVMHHLLPFDISYPIIIVGGLAITLALAHLEPMLGLTCSAATFFKIIVGTYSLVFLKQRLLGLSYILFSLFFVFFSVALFHYFLEGRQRLFLKRAFSRYVSSSVVNELLKNPARFTNRIETRAVSVLFCDIRNFATLSEKTPPDELGKFLNRYLSLMTDIIISRNGMVDKYIGDGIMAVWGTPLDDRHHAVNAVQAALEMVDTIQRNTSLLQLNGQSVTTGIGINTGQVSAGNFGSSKRFDSTVLGDNVNLASRLEGLTKFYHCTILISHYTSDRLDADTPRRFIDKVMVKGRHSPVDLFEPLVGTDTASLYLKEKDDYSLALDLYRAGRFKESLGRFAALHSTRPKSLYEIYMERNRCFLKTPPPPEWDGTHSHT